MDTRELDARVAREVMGFDVDENNTIVIPWNDQRKAAEHKLGVSLPKGDVVHYWLPPYSTDMNSAMEIEQKMHDLGWCSFTLMHHHPGGTWTAMFMNCGILAEAEAETAAKAVSLAALEAVAGKDKE